VCVWWGRSERGDMHSVQAAHYVWWLPRATGEQISAVVEWCDQSRVDPHEPMGSRPTCTPYSVRPSHPPVVASQLAHTYHLWTNSHTGIFARIIGRRQALFGCSLRCATKPRCFTAHLGADDQPPAINAAQPTERFQQRGLACRAAGAREAAHAPPVCSSSLQAQAAMQPGHSLASFRSNVTRAHKLHHDSAQLRDATRIAQLPAASSHP
jgi:hypothetical protein